MKKFTLPLLAALVLAHSVHAAPPAGMPEKVFNEWQQNVKPFRIVGNVYYVGSKGLASYLIVADNEAVLLDTAIRENAELIEENIRTLGLDLHSIKTILISHAHWDHVSALAKLKADTGARLVVMAEDQAAIEQGQHEGDNIYPAIPFAPTKVDRILADGDTVRIGEAELKATLTPGHSKGCTTWSINTMEGDRSLRVVFPCSISVAGNVLIGNISYPDIANDYRKTFKLLEQLDADVVLTNHTEVADLMGRKSRQEAGEQGAFIDPTLLSRIVVKAEAAFNSELNKQYQQSRQ